MPHYHFTPDEHTTARRALYLLLAKLDVFLEVDNGIVDEFVEDSRDALSRFIDHFCLPKVNPGGTHAIELSPYDLKNLRRALDVYIETLEAQELSGLPQEDAECVGTILTDERMDAVTLRKRVISELAELDDITDLIRSTTTDKEQ